MEVINFPKKEVVRPDIPAALRTLADEIESKSVVATEVTWVVLDDEAGEMYVGSAGEGPDSVYHIAGVLLTAANQMTLGDYDE